VSTPALNLYITNETVRRGVSQAAALFRAQPWSADTEWKRDASWVDARLCVAGGGVKPYERATCATADPICMWGYYSIARQCTEQVFSTIMFQGQRYEWAREQLRALRANRPARKSSEYATAWADWCLRVMRTVSLARWSTNITARYLKQGPAVTRAIAEIAGAGGGPAGVSRTAPLKTYGGMSVRRPIPGPGPDYQLMSLWLPRDLNATDRFPADSMIPSGEEDFTPRSMLSGRSSIYFDGRTPVAPMPPSLRGGGSAVVLAGESASATVGVRQQMVTWFTRTLGTGYWLREPTVAVTGYDGESLGPVPFFYGTGEATIRLCEAYIEDVLAETFGTIVSRGLKEYLTLYEKIPANMRAFTSLQISDMKKSITAKGVEEMVGVLSAVGAVVGAAATAINAAAGAVIAVVFAIVVAVLGLLQEMGGYAIGGVALEQACPPCPMVRMIPDGSACSFETRGAAQEDSVSRVRAVQQAAELEMPTSFWFQASARATESGSSLPSALEPKPPVKKTSPLLIGAGVGAGALLIAGLVKALR